MEATAMVFEAANLRILAEHTGVETSALPEGWHIPDSYIDSILNSVVTLSSSEVYGPEAYDRGRLLIWTAVLTDPELAHLRMEFESNGRLSGSSLYELFLKFVSLEGDEISPYIDSVTPDDLSAVSQVIRDTVRERSGQRGLDYPELATKVYVLHCPAVRRAVIGLSVASWTPGTPAPSLPVFLAALKRSPQ